MIHRTATLVAVLVVASVANASVEDAKPLLVNESPPINLTSDALKAAKIGSVEPVKTSESNTKTDGIAGRSGDMRGSAAASDGPPSVFVTSLNVNMIGWKMLTLNKRTIHAYQGIRYGKAERFKYSERSTPDIEGGQTSIVMDFIGDKCSQKSMLGHFATGSEDCLFLNVYVPEGAETPLPVMFFIHGGGFINGDASVYLPTRLLDQDVILVTIHYRLGSLGWFSLQNDDAPGNAGLSDQLLALRWVKENIADFGGNSSLVTIFGESAGSASVNMIQAVANKSEELFSGVIAESGSALDYWAIDNDPLESAKTFARICNCPDTEEEMAIYECVANMTHQELSMCTYEMVDQQQKDGLLLLPGCAPVVQVLGSGATTQPLISKPPRQYIEDGEAVDVPIMVGANRNEGSYVFQILLSQYLIPNKFINDTVYLKNDAVRDILSAYGINDQTHSLTRALEAEYFPGVNMSSFDEMTPGMIDVMGVLFIKAGTHQTATLHSRLYRQDTFLYSFDFESDNNLFWFLAPGASQVPFNIGVTHADELMYLFSMPSQLTEEQLLTSQRMVKLWTNFAKYRHPTPEEDDSLVSLGIPNWPVLTVDGKEYLLIQDELTSEVNYPDRWTIQMDMSTTVPETPVTVSMDDFDHMKKKMYDLVIASVVFITVFCIVGIVALFLYFRTLNF